MTLRLSTIISADFTRAFEKLCAEPMCIKDRYALARSSADIKQAMDAFEEARKATVKKHGSPERDVLVERLGKLEAQRAADSGNGQDTKTLDAAIAQTRARIVALDKNPEAGGWEIDRDNHGAMLRFNEEIAKLVNETTVPIYLCRKVKLSADSKLTAGDIAQLLDLVEVDD
jgi:hypothetical protein